MDDWQELQRREQALRDHHRADAQALYDGYKRRLDELERQFEHECRAIETVKMQCMARMAAQAAAAGGGQPPGFPQLPWSARPALPAIPSPSRLGTAVASPAVSEPHSISVGAAQSSICQSDAVTVPVSSQDASQELLSQATLQDGDEDDAISGIACDSGSQASGISLSKPGDGQQPCMHATAQTSDQQADDQPTAHPAQSYQQLPADEQQAPAAADAISSPDKTEPAKMPTQQTPPPLACSPSEAAPFAAATHVHTATAPDTHAATGSLQIAVSQPGPPPAGRAKRVQPTRVGNAAVQLSQLAAVSGDGTAADGAGNLAASVTPADGVAAPVPQQADLVAAQTSEVMAVLHSGVPGSRAQFLTNMSELAWPQARPRLHRRWKACGTQRPLPEDWPEVVGCRQLRTLQQRRWVAVQGRRLRQMRGDAVDQQQASATASQVPPDASGFGVQQLQADDGGAADADDSDGSLAPYGQDDDDFASEDEDEDKFMQPRQKQLQPRGSIAQPDHSDLELGSASDLSDLEDERSDMIADAQHQLSQFGSQLMALGLGARSTEARSALEDAFTAAAGAAIGSQQSPQALRLMGSIPESAGKGPTSEPVCQPQSDGRRRITALLESWTQQWRATQLPKLQADAYMIWHQVNAQRISWQEDAEHLDARLDRLIEERAQDMPASDAALARLCKALEPTLFDKLATHAKLDIAAGSEPPVPNPQQQPRGGRSAGSREASPAAHTGGSVAQRPADAAAQPAAGAQDAARSGTECTTSNEADSFLADAELPDDDQDETTSKGIRRPAAYNEAKATTVLVARNSTGLQLQQPAVQHAEAAEQPAEALAFQTEQPCSPGRAAEAKSASRQQAGSALQPEGYHRPESQASMQTAPNAGEAAVAAAMPDVPQAKMPAAAASQPACSDIIVLLSDDSEDDVAPGFTPDSGRTGTGGAALSAACDADVIVIRESEPQQDEDGMDVKMEDGVLESPIDWVPRVDDDVEALLELRTANDICWRPGVVTGVRERASEPPILHVHWSGSENSKKVRLKCLRPVLPAEIASLDLDRLCVGQVLEHNHGSGPIFWRRGIVMALQRAASLRWHRHDWRSTRATSPAQPALTFAFVYFCGMGVMEMPPSELQSSRTRSALDWEEGVWRPVDVHSAGRQLLWKEGHAELNRSRDKAAAQMFEFEASQAEGNQSTSCQLQAQLARFMARRPYAYFRRAQRAIGLAVPVTATPQRKGYRSTTYDTSLNGKAKKGNAVPAAAATAGAGEAAAAAAAALCGRPAASDEDEWPPSIQPIRAGKRPASEMQKASRAQARNKQQQEGLSNLQSKKRKLEAQRARRESISTMFSSQRQVELDQQERDAEVMLYPDDPRQTVAVVGSIAKHLKEHQWEGLRFLWKCCVVDHAQVEAAQRLSDEEEEVAGGCILAHSMGLGKTLQSIAFLHTFHSYFNDKRSLLVVPANVTHNWKEEFSKWLPSGQTSELTSHKVLVYDKPSDATRWAAASGSVLIISYDKLSRAMGIRAAKGKKGKRTASPAAGLDHGEADAAVADAADAHAAPDNRTEQEKQVAELLRSSAEVVIADEAHLLKNKHTIINIAMNLLTTNRKIALTGYPLQNNIKEYYIMVQWISQPIFEDERSFEHSFIGPITAGQALEATPQQKRDMVEALSILHDFTAQFIHRKGPEILELALPKKEEHILLLWLNPVQEKLYRMFCEAMSEKSSRDHLRDHRWLGKICNSPQEFVVDIRKAAEQESYKITSQTDDPLLAAMHDSVALVGEPGSGGDDAGSSRDASPAAESPQVSDAEGETGEPAPGCKAGKAKGRQKPLPPGLAQRMCKLIEEQGEQDLHFDATAKAWVVRKVLAECQARRDKLVVFSETLNNLDEVEAIMQHEYGWAESRQYLRLTGQTTAAKRQTKVAQFNSAASSAQVFIISTRAGSLGINLTAACRLLIFDEPYNPVHNAQAIARIFRFGQTRPSFVYRLLYNATFEFRLYRRNLDKEGLFGRVVEKINVKSVNKKSDKAFYQFLAASTIQAKRKQPVPSCAADSLLDKLITDDQAPDGPHRMAKWERHRDNLPTDPSEALTAEQKRAAAASYAGRRMGPRGAGGQSDHQWRRLRRIHNIDEDEARAAAHREAAERAAAETAAEQAAAAARAQAAAAAQGHPASSGEALPPSSVHPPGGAGGAAGPAHTQVQEVTALQSGGFADSDADQQAISEGDMPPVAMKDVAGSVRQ